MTAWRSWRTRHGSAHFRGGKRYASEDRGLDVVVVVDLMVIFSEESKRLRSSLRIGDRQLFVTVKCYSPLLTLRFAVRQFRLGFSLSNC